ncbi:MAG TPA: AI-2E family transporter [Longimicrobium sp.]|jgi:predicted PurR-regulated permease PerM
MLPETPESFNWRTIHSLVVLGVLGLFLYSVHSILNPFVLFLLLVFVISPYSGTRHHLLIVTSAAVLMLAWVLSTTGFLLAPFVLALVLAYIQHPLVDRLTGRRIGRLRVSRPLAVAILALPGIGVLALVVFVAAPALGGEVADFILRVPDYVRGFTATVERWERQLATRDLPLVDKEAVIARLNSLRPEMVTAWLEERQAAIARAAWQGVLGLGRGLGTILSILSYVFLTPILTFYLLRDWPDFEERLTALVPGPHRDRVVGFAREYDRLLSGYLRGQLIEATIVGVLTWLFLAVAGFPYALLLGFIAGAFNLIPYMGLVASAIPGVVIALFSGSPVRHLLTLLVVFAVVQVLDGAVLGPKIVGESVGLHPVWVILALAVCGFFFGFVGLLIAVPLAVLVKLLLLHALERYRQSRLFRGERPVLAAE